MGVDVMEHEFPLTPKEIVAEGNRLMSVLLSPAMDNYDEIKWMTQNGWLEIELDVSKTEKFVELEKWLSKEKEQLEAERDEQDEQEAFVHRHVIRHGCFYRMNYLDRMALKFVVPVDLSVHVKGVERSCRVFGLETSNCDDDENDYRVYALVTYADTPAISYFHKPFAEFSANEKEQLIDMMKQGDAGFFGDEKLGADPLPDDETNTIKEESSK